MNEIKARIGQSICRDVQHLLYDYTDRTLGSARSEFVREHVRRCAACRDELAAIQKTLAVLALARTAPVPSRLSAHHRQRMSRAVMNPVVNWIYKHNVIVAIAAMLLTILLSFLLLRWAMDVEMPDNSGAVPFDLTPRPIQFETMAHPTQPPLQEGTK